MEDLDKKIIELMDLFDGEVTTVDKIDRPEESLRLSIRQLPKKLAVVLPDC